MSNSINRRTMVAFIDACVALQAENESYGALEAVLGDLLVRDRDVEATERIVRTEMERRLLDVLRGLTVEERFFLAANREALIEPFLSRDQGGKAGVGAGIEYWLGEV